MAAKKTRLKEYKHGNQSVFAAQITAVEDAPAELLVNHPGAKTIHFIKPTGPSRAHMIPKWVEENNPQVGDYFVVEDDEHGRTGCRKMNPVAFEAKYKEKK